ncbi:copper resistance protein A [Cellvibrio sp. BR]|uniref:copper resistance system multicopper oxidase n=2 Tax=Cellvibrionales TaxID=1706369 RepID=UPI0002600953|nr:copper resistance protein A [Cellvibrio sp. BR]|tara:strand:+ start:18848 stop:20827 length:1980 start_codon:yes stop_codon:yes gene_type:complete
MGMKIPDTRTAGIRTTMELITAMDRYPVVPDVLPPDQSRRRFVLGASSLAALSVLPLSGQVFADTPRPTNGPQTLTGNQFDLSIGFQKVNFTGKQRIATTVNQGLPAPILRWKEGERVKLKVTNTLDHDTSIHWHGIILPSEMDGVPGMSFDGIKPGETFVYEFDVQQSGTYWYHSHSGFQEQTGLMGAIVIDPKDPDPVAYDRDMVVLLSDWTDTAPEKVYGTLKKMSHYYNFRERTVGDLVRDLKTKGLSATWNERAMWNQMRMSETDISDVTGYTYTYLMNGVTPDQGWLGLCKPGEKVRLRFINGAAMGIFDVRIPGLKMTVVAADGQNIQPIVVDEFRIGVAETYDVIVEPAGDSAYTIFAQSNDRTGYARGTLTTDIALRAEIPAMDPAPTLGHREMGMDMSGMDHSGHDMSGGMPGMDHSEQAKPAMEAMDHSGHDMSAMDHSGHDMSAMKTMDHSQHTGKSRLAKAGFGSNFDPLAKINHVDTEFGPHVDSHSDAPQSGLTDPGIGLRDHMKLYGRRVLTYADIRGLHPTYDKREPSREIELHLTGNMRRYMWSINGLNFADAKPLELSFGERVRIILVNDTMMTHPIHLHGMWSELETGDPNYIPRKHTIIVQPGSRISYLVTADAKGRWAYHCHLLYHMPGMMREVRVV